MSLPKFNPRTGVILFITIAVALLRILLILGKNTALANFSCAGAMALFGGAYFSDSRKAYLLPLLTLFISDLVLSFTVYSGLRDGFLYSGWYWTYVAFALMTMAGRLLIEKVTVMHVAAGIIACVLIHWIVSDIGTWLGTELYPRTAAGFWNCLVNAIPYERNFLAGTIIYSAIMFGLFEWLQYKNPALSGNKQQVSIA